MNLSKLFSFVVPALSLGAAGASDFKPAVVYDMSGKFDKSFIEGVRNGLQKFK